MKIETLPRYDKNSPEFAFSGDDLRRMRQNRLWNARLRLASQFERQQLSSREWISFVEIIDWRSRNQSDGSVNEQKARFAIADLIREVSAGTTFFPDGKSQILVLSPQFKITSRLVSDPLSLRWHAWLTSKRWNDWCEFSSVADMENEVLRWCWIPRDICLKWCASLPFEPKPEWVKLAEPKKPAAKLGRPHGYDWPLVRKTVFDVMNYHGGFSMDDPDFKQQSQLQEAVLKTLGMKNTSQVRAKVAEFCKEWRDLNENNQGI